MINHPVEFSNKAQSADTRKGICTVDNLVIWYYSSQKLPSDTQYLLEYMDTVPSDSSDDDFDGYLSDEQGADIDDSGSEKEDCTEPSKSSEEYQGWQQSMYLDLFP